MNKAEYNKKYRADRPWLSSFYNAKKRCETGKYKDKGIEFIMLKEDFKELWFRDNAYKMEHPSIDRIDSEGDYIVSNCRFIEVAENRLGGIVGRTYTDEQRKRLSESNKEAWKWRRKRKGGR